MPRGGKHGRSQTRSLLTKRLLPFRTNNLANITEDLTSTLPAQMNHHVAIEVAEDGDQQLESVRRRIHALVAAGNLSKAARELVSTGTHEMTPTIQQKLHDLHPQTLRAATSLPAKPPLSACAQCETFWTSS